MIKIANLFKRIPNTVSWIGGVLVAISSATIGVELLTSWFGTVGGYLRDIYTTDITVEVGFFVDSTITALVFLLLFAIAILSFGFWLGNRAAAQRPDDGLRPNVDAMHARDVERYETERQREVLKRNIYMAALVALTRPVIFSHDAYTPQDFAKRLAKFGSPLHSGVPEYMSDIEARALLESLKEEGWVEEYHTENSPMQYRVVRR
jgi:hypothetical protein